MMHKAHCDASSAHIYFRNRTSERVTNYRLPEVHPNLTSGWPDQGGFSPPTEVGAVLGCPKSGKKSHPSLWARHILMNADSLGYFE